MTLHEDGSGAAGDGTGAVQRRFEPALWTKLLECSAAEDASPVAIGLAAFALLLERLAGGDVVVTACAPRRADIDPRRAWFDNATALRLIPRASRARSFVDAARAVQSALTAGIGARKGSPKAPDYTFELAETASKSATLHGDPPPIRDSAGDSTQGIALRHAALSLALTPPQGRHDGVATLTFARSRFSVERAGSLLGAYLAVLEQAVATPSVSLSDLILSDSFDRARNWPAIPTDPSCALAADPRDLPSLFSAIVERWPSMPAAIGPGRRVTFSELDALARSLGILLEARGCRREHLVGFRLAADADPWHRVLYLATQLACFRNGYAILPLGQQHAAAQAAALVDALGVTAVLDATGRLDVLPAGLPYRSQEAVEGFPGAVLATVGGRPAPLPAGTSVVLTTSGTTGPAKAICLSQAMLLGLLRGVTTSGIVPTAPWLMGPNIAFDMSLADVWLPWIQGHPVILLPTERRTPAALAQAKQLGARVVSLSPTVAAAALRSDRDCFGGLDALLLVGETLPPPLVRTLAARAPQLRVINGYGPSEMAVFTSLWVADAATGPASLPIGWALPGYHAVIADPATLTPLPAHWPGELLIRCPAAALGYADPSRTDARFVSLPGEPGGSFFRSGDHAWIDARGQLRFIGRTDRQIKLHGVRVELDGIERVIAEVPGVAEVAVLTTGRAGSTQVIAVLAPCAPRAEQSALRAAVLEACRAWLPRAAVPARILFVASMPRGSSGKVARQALLARIAVPDADSCGVEGAPPPPGSATSRVTRLWLAQLREKGLTLSSIGLHADVFALGATSLDAVCMAERLERSFGVVVPEEQMFIHRTVASQATLVTQTPRGEMPVPAGLPSPIAARLARGVDGSGVPEVLTLPGIHGDADALGPLIAQTLPDHAVRVITAVPEGGNLVTEARWQAVAGSIVAALGSGAVPTPCALIGFSLGGWLAWLVDRMRVAAGHAPLPVINIDGGALHLHFQALRPEVDRLLPAMEDLATCRMLLIHRAQPKRFRSGPSLTAQWRRAGVEARAIAVHSVRHADTAAAPTVAACSEAIAAFVADPDGPAALQDAIRPAGLGGALFRLLRSGAPPTPEGMRQILAELPPGRLDASTVHALLFLTMASGDPGLALKTARVLAVRHPAMRQPAFAEVAILAALGRQGAAERRARQWRRRRPDDAAIMARADEPVAIAAGGWTDASRMLLMSDAALRFAAQLCAHRVTQES